MAAHVQQQKAVIPGHEEMIECLEGAFECQVLERQCYSGSGPLVQANVPQREGIKLSTFEQSRATASSMP